MGHFKFLSGGFQHVLYLNSVHIKKSGDKIIVFLNLQLQSNHLIFLLLSYPHLKKMKHFMLSYTLFLLEYHKDKGDKLSDYLGMKFIVTVEHALNCYV